MSFEDSRRALSPNIEWSVRRDRTIFEEVIYGDYQNKGPAKTHHDVDPSLKEPYFTEELYCSMGGGQTKYELLESYWSTNVAATQARQARDTARQERLKAQSATQATYLKSQNETQAAQQAYQESFLTKQRLQQAKIRADMEKTQATARAKHKAFQAEHKASQATYLADQKAEQAKRYAKSRRNTEAATASTAGSRLSGGEKRTGASSTLGGQCFGPGATPHFGTDENGVKWGGLGSGAATYLGELYDEEVSQPANTEATASTPKSERKKLGWLRSFISRGSRSDQA